MRSPHVPSRSRLLYIVRSLFATLSVLIPAPVYCALTLCHTFRLDPGSCILCAHHMFRLDPGSCILCTHSLPHVPSRSQRLYIVRSLFATRSVLILAPVYCVLTTCSVSILAPVYCALTTCSVSIPAPVYCALTLRYMFNLDPGSCILCTHSLPHVPS